MTTFTGLLLRWKASVYKIIWVEMIAFLVAFFVLSFIYRYGLKSRESQEAFEDLCEYAFTYRSTLPISFILGFYVTVIYNRWWSQFNAIPRPDAIAANVAAHIQGTDEDSRLLRRTMVRYVNLAATLTYCAISTSVKKRFPTQEHLVKAGLLMTPEKEMLNSVQSEHPKYWIPCVWYINLLRKAEVQKKISNAPGMKTLLDELNKFREKCDALYSYDWIEVPVVYTQAEVKLTAWTSNYVKSIHSLLKAVRQKDNVHIGINNSELKQEYHFIRSRHLSAVVTLAVYSYFVASLFSHQFLKDVADYQLYRLDIYIPFSCLFELVFYIGWLKVAEKIMDPFGDDEHDFDMNVIVDRNWQVSYLTVDNMYDADMTLVKDPHYQAASIGLPHTKASRKMPISKGSVPWLGSANLVRLTGVDMETVDHDLPISEAGCCSCFGKKKTVQSRRIDNSLDNSAEPMPVVQGSDVPLKNRSEKQSV